jgi:threo-3-hydroxy-L-aspartate ammonia-lyase
VIGADDVAAAAGRLEGVTVRTPVLRCPPLDEATGTSALLKGDHVQRTGSFKLRGAWNAVAQLDDDARSRGVVTASSGNFAQALALSAKLAGIPATILMPTDAPPNKVELTRSHGANVVFYDRYADDREARSAALVADTGGTFVHPYDDDHVMAGQGTAALELIEDAGALDVLIVPVGGGGLISGCATIAVARSPGVRVIGVEPAAGDDVRRSLERGVRVTIDVPRTIADGQQTTSPGVRNFPVIQAHVAEVVTVTDEEIVAAMRMLRDGAGAVVEPSGATATAALLAGRVALDNRARVGVILSGGNITPERFASLVDQ